jgi:NAD+ synthase (glutamine-hydrolysing)
LQNVNGIYKEILDISDGIAIIYGNIYLDEEAMTKGFHPNEDGRIRRYNAVYVVQNGKMVRKKTSMNFLPDGLQAKTLLPNYRIFDDKRYFYSSLSLSLDYNVPLTDILQPFVLDFPDIGSVQIGVELCEDLWCKEYRFNLEALNPTKILVDNGSELIINISCSPWTIGKNNARDRRVEFLYQELGNRMVPFYYVNNVGAQNNGKNFVTFDGGSTVYNCQGKPVFLANSHYKEEILEIHPSIFEKSPQYREEKPSIQQKFDAIVCGLKHLNSIMNKETSWIIGLSGGIDSSVVAALCTWVFGPERVMGVNMPTKYNSKKTQDTARKVAQNLGIRYLVVPIEDLVNLNDKIIEDANFGSEKVPVSQLNKENIQAKIRGTSILSNLAAKYGGIFTNNGNKVEIALGYATLYGDVGGAVAPIGDLTKKEVYDLGRYLNDLFKKEIIPEILFPDELFRFGNDKIIPSAELKEGQIDPMKYGYHCAVIEKINEYTKCSIEDFCRWYLDGTICSKLNISEALFKRYNLDNPAQFIEDLEWIFKLIQSSVFKRIQAPPIIITSRSAYGYDIRESQLPVFFSNEYSRLKKKILSKE